MAKIPDQVAGFRIRGGEPLGIGTFGRTFLATRDGTWGLLKLLRRGERLSGEDYERLCADPRVLGFREESKSDDRLVLSAVRPTAAPLGIVAGGSPLQRSAERAAQVLDPQKQISLALLRSTLAERVLLLRDLASALAGLEQAGWLAPYLSPWNVLVVREDDGARLIPCEVGLDYEDDPELIQERLHEDAMVYVAPEFLAGLLGRGTRQEPTPAGVVYSFGATAWTLLHDQPVIPLGTAGRELAPCELVNAPSRRVRALGNGGVSVAAGGLSSELASLLAQTLSLEPQRRPGMKEVAERLDELLSDRRVAHGPSNGWGAFAVATALVIGIVWWVAGLAPPSTGRLQAIEAFAAATNVADLEARDAALLNARVTIGGEEVPLPEAKRLLAIDGWLRWQARAREGKPPSILEVVHGLEADAVRGYEDSLGRHLRFLVGYLRRWELGGEERAEGDEHLAALADDPSASKELRALAAAARALGPTEGELGSEETVAEWLRAATRAASPVGFLVTPQPVVDYGDLGLGQPLNPVSLKASWIAELIAGRIRVLQRKIAAGVGELEAVHKAIPTYAARLTLGYAYIMQGGAATAKGDRLLEQARAIRNDSALHLTRARVALRLGRYGAVRAALDDALAVEPGKPAAAARVRWQVQALRREASFRESVSLADRGVPTAEVKLRGALASARSSGEEDALRLIPDLTIALGLFLAGQGRAAEARRILWKLYDKGVLDAGWTKLPVLTPTPPTRRSARVRRLLIQGLLEEARAAVDAPGFSRDDLLRLAKRFKRLKLKEPLEPEEGFFRAWYQLVKAKVARARKPGADVSKYLDGPQARMELALRSDPPSEQAEAWLLRAALLQAEGQPAAARVGILGRALAYPSTGRAAKMRQEMGRALNATVEGVMASRRKAWDAIAPEAPRYDAALGKAEEATLVAAVSALAGRPGASKLVLATCHHVLALLRWSRGADAEAFAAVGQALGALAELGGEPEADELTKRIVYGAGLAALRSKGEALKLNPSRLGYACAMLSRSLGEEGYPQLVKSLAEGDEYHPFGPAGREQAPLFWLARARAEEAKALEGAGAEAAKREVVSLYRAFGRLLGDAPTPLGAERWKQELSALEAALPPQQDPPQQDPPKQDPPKQDPPKQDPFKQDPPKQDPPKKEK